MKMTKKTTLLIAVGALSVAYVIDYLYKSHSLISRDLFNLVLPTLFFYSLPLLIFSLITYKMREEVFRAWLHFTYWLIPLSIILTFVTPDGSGGGSWGIPVLIDREFVALIFSALFTIVSLILIAWKYFTTRNQGANT